MFIPGNITLFEGIAREQMPKLLACLNSIVRSYKEGETILAQGSKANSIGIVLQGFVRISRNDSEGHRAVQAEFGVGSVFAESIVFAGIENSPVKVESKTETEILFIPYKHMLRVCATRCEMHSRLIENAVKMVAQKNLILNSKVEILSKRSTREKVLTFIQQEVARQKHSEVQIFYNRQELADYLCVDRSALSRELSNMKKEGILQINETIYSLID